MSFQLEKNKQGLFGAVFDLSSMMISPRSFANRLAPSSLPATIAGPFSSPNIWSLISGNFFAALRIARCVSLLEKPVSFTFASISENATPESHTPRMCRAASKNFCGSPMMSKEIIRNERRLCGTQKAQTGALAEMRAVGAATDGYAGIALYDVVR
jgi:hypothetical protein